MIPNTGTAVIVVVAFLLPGFVTVLLQERTFKSANDASPLDRLLLIVWYSAWSYILLAGAAIVLGVDRHEIVSFYHRHTHDPAQLIWRGALIVLIPSLIIEESTRWWNRRGLRLRLLNALRVNARHMEPTAWDFFFGQEQAAYVRVTFADGTRVLGFYGAESFAAYSKDGRDLYLERTLMPNNLEDQWFGEETPGTCGVWIKTDDVVSVEFYPPTYVREAPKSRFVAAVAAALTTAFAVSSWLGRGKGRAHGSEGQPNPAQAAATTACTAAEEGVNE